MSKQKTMSYFGKRKQQKDTVPEGNSRWNEGGELHQIAGGEHPALTTNQGAVLSDNQNSLRANPRGPALLEDFIFREKITHFDHERIPERIVHARATGVHGFFELTASLKQYTTARILTEVVEKTPVFNRRSTVAGGARSHYLFSYFNSVVLISDLRLFASHQSPNDQFCQLRLGAYCASLRFPSAPV